MKRTSLQGIGALALVAVLGLACGKQSGPAPDGPSVVASVGGKAISHSELDSRLKSDREISSQLADLERQRYELTEDVLGTMIDDKLFEREAQKRGQSVEQLLAAEVDAKVTPVTEAEKRARYEAVKAQVKGRPEADVLREIEAGMREQRLAERRAALARELWAKGDVAVALEPPRVTVDAGTAAALGPANAPLTIIEFSDFQCPYCGRGAATLGRVRQLYGDRLRLVFRHFPLRQIHPRASQAAEAAGCAGEQGRFWEMHDRLFQNQAKLELADLKRYATELGLDAAAFNRCLETGRQAAAVQADLAAGEALGIRGTPAFFINGRLLAGALPFERFVRVVEIELARAAKPSAANTAASR